MRNPTAKRNSVDDSEDKYSRSAALTHRDELSREFRNNNNNNNNKKPEGFNGKIRQQIGIQWTTLKTKMRAAMRKTKKAMTEKTIQ